MRTSNQAAILCGLVALSACGRHAAAPAPADVPGAAVIACTLGKGTAQRCTVERARAGDAVDLVLHHPDGGFRRLRVATDGRGVTSADGAVAAQVRVAGPGAIEVAIEGDRYRLPATFAPPK